MTALLILVVTALVFIGVVELAWRFTPVRPREGVVCPSCSFNHFNDQWITHCTRCGIPLVISVSADGEAFTTVRATDKPNDQ